MAKAKRVALVIGNSGYVQDPLPNPVRDAALITTKLVELGYTVIGGAATPENPTGLNAGVDPSWKASFDLAEAFIEAIEPSSTVVIYYAGHALQVGDQNFMMPVDCDLSPDKPDLGLVRIKPLIQRAATKAGAEGTVVAFLDACRNNPLDERQLDVLHGRFNDVPAREFGQRGMSATISRGGLATIKMDLNAEQARTFIGFATAPGAVSYDGKRGSQNSPFAQALGRHLTTRGLSIEDLYDRVAKDVLEQVRSELGRFQDPWSETNLNRACFLSPRSMAPIWMLGLGGLIAGLIICLSVFDATGLANPLERPWMWGMGILFGLVSAYGTWRWGAGKPFDLMLAVVGPTIGFALALSIMKLIPETPGWSVTMRAGPASDVARQIYITVTVLGGLLYMIGIAVVWRENPPGWPRTPLAWLNRILSLTLPVIVVVGLLLLLNYISRTNPLLTALALFTVLGGVIYGMSVALSLRSQRGLFSQFGPITGAISIGLLMAVLFAVYASVTSALGMSQAESAPVLIALGALWHLMLGAQLGYCFAYYVPDYRQWSPEA